MDIQEAEKCPKCMNSFDCSKSGKCWCFEVNIPQEILDQIQEQYNSCLCPNCLEELLKTKS